MRLIEKSFPKISIKDRAFEKHGTFLEILPHAHCGAPKPLSNGQLPVAEWREFVRLHGLKGGETITANAEALKARKLLAEVEERELKVAIKKGEYVLLEDVRQEWTTQVGKAIALLRAKFENELPPILSGKDAQGIREECSGAIDEVCRTLHSN